MGCSAVAAVAVAAVASAVASAVVASVAAESVAAFVDASDVRDVKNLTSNYPVVAAAAAAAAAGIPSEVEHTYCSEAAVVRRP